MDLLKKYSKQQYAKISSIKKGDIVYRGLFDNNPDYDDGKPARFSRYRVDEAVRRRVCTRKYCPLGTAGKCMTNRIFIMGSPFWAAPGEQHFVGLCNVKLYDEHGREFK